MKNKLPVLTLSVLLAAGGAFSYRNYRFEQERAVDRQPSMSIINTADGTAEKASTGDELLLQVRTQVERRASIAARMRHQVSLNGRHLFGVGGYWQQGTGDELKVRLEVQFANDQTGLLQVSNGRFLWTDQRLPAGRSITRLDLRKVRADIGRAADEIETLAPGDPTWTDSQPDFSLRYGGLPTLLKSLSEHFRFQPPQAMRWTPSPQLPGLSESFPVFAVVGHWKAKSLAAIAPGISELRDLPPRLPQEVLVLFGQNDYFPYRIEFRKLLNTPDELAENKPLAPFRLSSDPLVLVEFSAVRFDAQIAAGQFDFAPGDAEWDDRTAEHLQGLRRQRDARSAHPKLPQ